MTRADVKGLDTLRFVAAAWVMLSHGVVPLRSYLPGTGVSHLAVALYENAFNGPAAVFVFFVISGFCIHYAYVRGRPFLLLPFLVRRGVRIILPLLAAVLLAAFLGRLAQGALFVVLWSVYCEIIYYALYPLLRRLFARFGVRAVTLFSFLPAIGIVLWQWHVPYHWGLGVGLTWIVGLPAWLLGCLLAQKVGHEQNVAAVSALMIWCWRLLAWSYGAACLVIFYHAPWRIGHPALLLPFYLLCYAWIAREIAYWDLHKASRFLEWCGTWSYSLYLVHNMVIAITPRMAQNPALDGGLRLLAVAAASLIFFGAIEWPSHQLARRTSRAAAAWLGARPSAADTGLA